MSGSLAIFIIIILFLFLKSKKSKNNHITFGGKLKAEIENQQVEKTTVTCHSGRPRVKNVRTGDASPSPDCSVSSKRTCSTRSGNMKPNGA